ncbi:asp/Glu/Hydantoin racemase family protein [Burkholderia pseudomallei]|nr:asp/Glu/Hydantoin racemase family protein [Burkholderia pseudomallei]
MLRHFARQSLPAVQRTAVRSCVRPLRSLPAPAPSGALNPFDRSSTEVRRDRPPAHRRRQRAALRAGGRRARRPDGLAHARGAPRSARRRRARGRRRRAARAERRAPPRGARRACARRHAVVLACSARGPSVDALAAHPKPVVRADAALAHACARAGERIAVPCAAPSSERPTRALFERQARETLARMEVWVVPDAWARFRAGDAAGYRDYRGYRAGSRRCVGAELRCRRVRAGFDGDRRVGRDARTAAAHGAPRRARARRAGAGRRIDGARSTFTRARARRDAHRTRPGRHARPRRRERARRPTPDARRPTPDARRPTPGERRARYRAV